MSQFVAEAVLTESLKILVRGFLLRTPWPSGFREAGLVPRRKEYNREL